MSARWNIRRLRMVWAVDLGAEGEGVFVTKPLEPFRPDTMRRGQADHAAIDDEDHAPKSATDANAAPGDRLEDRVDVGWGATDHAEDLTGRSFPLQRPAHLCMRLGQRMILLLQLLEQPRVLEASRPGRRRWCQAWRSVNVPRASEK
jgi:hypothetical protein